MSLVEKNAEPTPSFEEQMRAAEEAAGMPPDAELYGSKFEHPEPDELGRVPSASRPRDPETGRFISESEEEVPVEAEAEPEVEVADTQAGEPELESDPLAELNKKVGQLINENADLRRELAERPDPAEQFQQWAAEQEQAQRGQYSPDQFEVLLETDPAQATMLAHQRGDQIGYARGWQAWNDVAPGAPQIWADNQNLRAQLSEFQKGIVEQIAPARAAAGRQELTDAMHAVAARHDDYAEVMGSANENDLKAFVSDFPLMAEVLQKGLTGDQRAKEQVYETLYRWRKAEVSDQLKLAAREAPKRHTEEARDAKREAFVASASTTTPDEVPETEEQRLARVWAESRPRLRDAWDNRAPSRIGR